MSWFQLSPEAIAGRVRSYSSQAVLAPPTLTASVVRGIAGFTVVSVAGFAPWALLGRWLERHVGEAGMYVACALVFIGLSGALMHRLILGPGSLSRFYKLFGLSFAAYSVAWIAGWMALRGHPGSLVGLLAGTMVMGWMFVRAFDAQNALLKVVVALFVGNALGYFVGGWMEAAVLRLPEMTLSGEPVSRRTRLTVAMLLWGVCYGIGLGAGLGFAFHACQDRARRLLRSSLPESAIGVS